MKQIVRIVALLSIATSLLSPELYATKKGNNVFRQKGNKKENFKGTNPETKAFWLDGRCEFKVLFNFTEHPATYATYESFLGKMLALFQKVGASLDTLKQIGKTLIDWNQFFRKMPPLQKAQLTEEQILNQMPTDLQSGFNAIETRRKEVTRLIGEIENERKKIPLGLEGVKRTTQVLVNIQQYADIIDLLVDNPNDENFDMLSQKVMEAKNGFINSLECELKYVSEEKQKIASERAILEQESLDGRNALITEIETEKHQKYLEKRAKLEKKKLKQTTQTPEETKTNQKEILEPETDMSGKFEENKLEKQALEDAGSESEGPFTPVTKKEKALKRKSTNKKNKKSLDDKIKNLEINKPKTKQPVIKKDEIKNLEIKQPKTKQPVIKKDVIKNLEIKQPKTKQPVIKKDEIKNLEIKQPKTKQPVIKKDEIKNLEIKKNLETKQLVIEKYEKQEFKPEETLGDYFIWDPTLSPGKKRYKEVLQRLLNNMRSKQSVFTALRIILSNLELEDRCKNLITLEGGSWLRNSNSILFIPQGKDGESGDEQTLCNYLQCGTSNGKYTNILPGTPAFCLPQNERQRWNKKAMNPKTPPRVKHLAELLLVLQELSDNRHYSLEQQERKEPNWASVELIASVGCRLTAMQNALTRDGKKRYLQNWLSIVGFTLGISATQPKAKEIPDEQSLINEIEKELQNLNTISTTKDRI